ncbi:MAG: signal recognition particle protein [Pantoea sp. Brub]|nr:signal recognition particle protein [Pantoea sp. Brub]
MFDNLTNRLSQTLRNIRGIGRLTEENIKNTLHEVSIALLEADVALSVVRDFTNRVKKISVGRDVNKCLTPGQEFIKIVRDELIVAMGTANNHLNLAIKPPAIIMLIGLQGVGKTTSICKLGKFLKEKYKKHILMVSIDIYRPAAIKQLETLSKQININFYPSSPEQKPIQIVQSALKETKIKFYDVLLIDTPGILHTDKFRMEELKQIRNIINPIEILFVIDSMMGQDAINVAKSFNDQLSFTGIILTKTDGDTRGGAALSVRHITGKPIKFIGTGEKIECLEQFYPDRIASRILGMGDVISLIENLESKVNTADAKKLVKQIKTGNYFDLYDFLQQIKQIRKMGNINNLIAKLPMIGNLPNNMQLNINNDTFLHMEAIINSMTNQERKNPEIIKGSHKRRIANGSGMQIQDVNRLLKQFNDMKLIIKKMKKGGMRNMMGNIKNMISPIFFK